MNARMMLVALACAGTSAVLSGCSSIGAASGAVAGVATGTFTGNPAVGIGVGIAVQSATDEAVNRYMRVMHRDQQDAIAMLVGETPVGASQPWRVDHRLPVENGHGEVRVTREIRNALAVCKEFAFSLVDGDKPGAKVDWFTASACQQGGRWKWASAEPAVDRWGTLQ
ncbi:hypothetical protein [Trinickia soli]|uniref:Lipoprotein n=1 Tax=Trinickia soli TaxID=380675 RepID=A0A2N7W4H6_9BURK|nr:hypothetical protein [Trinickia soli]KAA0080963.1 hypothetical protein CIW54_22200 [Paraburkholderia sp. T12-10]PMS24307.1 hypothetical protein C0Z19_13600 [Trinickia soli]CAB3674222.1 hypothetical protein LMG24076_02081 [Trinickia soli]